MHTSDSPAGVAALAAAGSDATLPLLEAPDSEYFISNPSNADLGAAMYGRPTDITEDTIRELALPLGLVDIKVCAVSEIWSGLKLVIRKELR